MWPTAIESIVAPFFLRLWAVEDCRQLTGWLERQLLSVGEELVRVPPKLTVPERRAGRTRGKSDPIDYLPSGVRLTAYGGDAADLPAGVLQSYLDAVAAGRLTVPIHRTYALDEIAQAHADMEHGRATGKLVVLA